MPFDLRHLRCIVYEHNLRGAIKLKEQLQKTITDDPHFYSKIPVDILTDKFVGGFSLEKYDLNIEFFGHRGNAAKFTEKYSIIAEHNNLMQIYKKLQCTGHIISAGAENAAVETKQLFIGMHLLSIILPKSLSIGEKLDFTLQYELGDNFPDEKEFWFFNAEVSIGLIQT